MSTSGFGAPSDAPASVLDVSGTILHGYFNSTHLSGLFIYYPAGSLPTPWPWLLVSMLLSLTTGVIGVRSAFASWKDLEPSRFAVIRTTVSFAYVCLRAIVAFVVAIRATLGTHSNHPPPSSLLLLMGSLQTYIGSRTIPSICNFALVLCQILVYAALILAMQNGSYGRFSVSGGNCPEVGGLDYAAPVFVENCLNSSRKWRAVGCQVLSGTDPNESRNKIVTIEDVSAYIGGVYFFTIIIALFDTFSVRSAALFKPVKRETSKRLKFAVWVAVFSLIFGVIYTPIVVATHYNQLKQPNTLTFADSWGSLERINRTALSAKNASTFGYNEPTHWTDCFNATTPYSRDGFFKEWWQEVDPVPRVLAFV